MFNCLKKAKDEVEEIQDDIIAIIEEIEEIEGYSENFFKRCEGNGLFSQFQSFLRTLDAEKIGVSLPDMHGNSIFEKYEGYLSEGIPSFYLKLINGHLENFEANSLDPVMALFIIGSYYGVKSLQYETVKDDVFDGTKYDPNFEGIIITYISNLKRRFHKPEKKFFGGFYSETEDPNCYPLKDICTIALFADWATGTTSSIALLKEVAKFNPDVAIHLGDTYYSGTAKEQKDNMIVPLKKYLPETRCFFTPGNHDWYAGNKGINYALKALGQNATFFSLYNSSFQIEGCDTGFNDANPFLTFKETAHNTKLVAEEMDWHTNRIQQARASNRKVILLSHHMPVAPWAPSGNVDDKPSPVNQDLFDQFKDHLDVVEGWFFGHDHSFCLMEPYEYKGAILKRPVLMGNGACQYREQSLDHYETEKTMDFEDKQFAPPKPKPIFPGMFNSYLNNCFVILKLEEHRAVVSYYEVPQIDIDSYGEAHLLHSEEL